MVWLACYCLWQPSDIQIIGGSATKVSQVTGELDRQYNKPSDNRTESRFGLFGTDLGASFEHRGKVVFLFGDTKPVGPHTPERRVDGDAIAFSNDVNPDDGLSLDFLKDQDDKYFTVKIPGVSLAGFEVPSGGFSDGKSMFAFYTTQSKSTADGQIMGQSVLANSSDGRSWKTVYVFSKDKFINISPVVVDASKLPGLPVKSGKGILCWASGTKYRRSNVSLAFVPMSRIGEKSQVRYWVSNNKWSTDEKEANSLFEDPQVGELSVAWCDSLKRWLMLYNGVKPRGILLRTSTSPTGPWSEPQILFDPAEGYGKFMHVSWSSAVKDSVHDRGRQDEWGGEYGPYMIPRFFRGKSTDTTIYFLMSIWNPYNVVLMRARLAARPSR